MIKYAIFQRTLYGALYEFLYVSLKGTSLQSFRDRHWISTGALRNIRGVALRMAGQDAGVPRQLADRISPAEYAGCLARVYAFWRENMPTGNGETRPLPQGRRYDDWLAAGGSASKYWPLHKVEQRLGEHGKQFFLRSLLHGSLGTLDDMDGFSDMDLAFVVRESILLEPESLLALREFSREILTLTYSFDPFMHHGPYYLSESDLKLYPEGLFPSVLFAHGVEIFDPDGPLKICPYAGEYLLDDLLEYFRKQFERWGRSDSCIRNGWDVEVIFGSAMLLPALYLQRMTGKASYKRDTFARARGDFSPEDWWPVEIATEWRRALRGRYRPSGMIYKVARGLKWPGLIQRRGLHRRDQQARAKAVAQKVDSQFAACTEQLIRTMQDRIERADQDSDGDGARKIFEQAFAGLQAGPFTDKPFVATREDYDTAKSALIERWLSQAPKPMAIYQLGEVGSPGFSDLDFIIIWPEHTPIPYSQFGPAQAPDEFRPYLMHPPYFCTPALWNELHAWYPAFQVDHVWGDKMELPVASDEDQPGLALGHLAEALATKLPEDLFYHSWQNPIRIRVVVNTLFTIKYVCRLAETAGLSIRPGIRDVVTAVQKLRAEWMENTEASIRTLRHLCVEACVGLAEVLSDLAVWLEERVVLPGGASGSGKTANLQTVAMYARRCRSAWYSTGKTPRLTSPALCHLTGAYRNLCPEMGAALAPFDPDGGKVLDEHSIYARGLARHVRVMKQYADTMVPLGVPPMKYLSLGYAPAVARQTTRPVLTLRDKLRWRARRSLQLDFYLQATDHILQRAGF